MKKIKTTALVTLMSLGMMFFGCDGTAQSKVGEASTGGDAPVKAAVAQGSVQNISQEEFLKIQAEGKAVVMDVRTPGEVAAGYIKGTTVFADINGATFAEEIAKLDKTKPYLIYCRSGARSGRAAQMMLNQGFSTVYNLSGGISNWRGEVVK